ncbi:MAG: hypothetical protein OEM97_09480 [Acidimicrobiia bacterium]|nr:hypothetical protein [Acidimicrobiia bacterium]
MTLDERARYAARELNTAVGEADLLLFESGIPALRQKPAVTQHRPRGYVFAGAFAAILLFIGLTIAPGRLTAPDDPDGSNVANEQSVETPKGATDGDGTENQTATTVQSDGAPVTSLVGVDLTPPVLTVSSPQTGAEFSPDDFEDGRPLLTFEGTSEPGATVIARTGQADEPTVVVGPDGTWEFALILPAEQATFRFVAVDAANNEQHAEVTVTYTPDTASTTTTAVPAFDGLPQAEPLGSDVPAAADVGSSAVAFSAAATVGEAYGEPASDIFYGTAKPGSVISLTSEYGGVDAVANGEGNWQALMVFRQAPIGEPFLVTVTADTGERVKLGFVVRTAG